MTVGLDLVNQPSQRGQCDLCHFILVRRGTFDGRSPGKQGPEGGDPDQVRRVARLAFATTWLLANR